MKNNFYLKLVVALFAAMPCFADGVDIIGKEYGDRQGKFNANPLDTSLCEPHTTNINGVLKEERNVVVDRAATDDEKEMILKAVMTSVVIHGFDESATSVFDKRSTLTDSTAALGRHFEILRLTEALAGDFMAQLSTGFMNIAALAGYENLYGFSGKGAGVFEGWFKDVVSEHIPGLAQLMSRRVDGLSSDVKSLQRKFFDYGDVGDNTVCIKAAVFVSTYDGPTLTKSIVIHLPDAGGRQRYVVIQNPPFSYESTSTQSPFSIRAHPLFSNQDVSIDIRYGQNRSPAGSMSNIGMSARSININTHGSDDFLGATFSPNNAHLQGLPERLLEGQEIYSFQSNIDGNGASEHVDTFHFLLSPTYYEAINEHIKQSRKALGNK